MNGIICLNKPKDYTSFDVVARLRGMTKQKRVGHAGTLDPMATGVLPIFVGNATKACDIMPNQNKRYKAEFVLGITTNTQDITGEILEQKPSNIKKEQILEQIELFKGEIFQLPPMFSAIRVEGRRLYDIARQGLEIERELRKITIFEITLLSFDEETQSGVIDVLCSKGTYIRTLVFDIGKNLEVGATLTNLERTMAGNLTLDDTITIDEAQELAQIQGFESVLIPTDRIFAEYKEIRLNEAQSRMFKNGVKLDINRIKYPKTDEFLRVYSNTDEFLGLASLDFSSDTLVIEKMFYINQN
jgi:tRNA pseudouridine55 synthase